MKRSRPKVGSGGIAVIEERYDSEVVNKAGDREGSCLI